MSNISFYGASGTVTGSRFLLDLNGERILVDCGLFQGTKENRERNWAEFPAPPSSIHRMLVTHAHIDHTGYIPCLAKHGFRGPITTTHATRELAEIMLRDSAHLQEEDAKYANEKGFSKHSPALPLYDIDDAEKALSLFKPVHYGEDHPLGEDGRVKFRNAGHILGSAFIDIKTRRSTDRPRKILFSGDFGRPARPLLMDPDQVFNVDYLVLESTYGDRLHDGIDPKEELARVINESIERGGVLLIPSFAVGRTQTLLYVIRELEEEKKIPVLPVYVDSPMSLRATEVFEHRIVDLNIPSRVKAIGGTKIYRTGDLHLCATRTDSKQINRIGKRAIIISSSGMATGGRILHHLAQRLPHAVNTLLFIGYQAEETRGRKIMEGAKDIKIHGAQVPVNAKLESITGFSGHGDYNDILAWLMSFNRPPEKTFIVHGEPEASASLAEKIRTRFGWDVVIPAMGETHELDM